MPVLPFHKYLGPGNDLDNGDPVDEDDRIAQEHDSAYASAISAADITAADDSAIEQFQHDFSTSGNWHSLLGAAGLQVKRSVEQYTGVLYPGDMSDRERRYKQLSLRTHGDRREEHISRQSQLRADDVQARRDRTQAVDQPSGSHDVSDVGQQENNAPMATDEVDAVDAAGMGMPGSAGVTNPGSQQTIYFTKALSTPSFTFFRKSRLMHTWGFTSGKFLMGPKKAAATVDTDLSSNYIAYSTSLAYVPVDWIPFYLSPVEFESLPLGSYIAEVHVEIIPKGVRCSFDTGTTLTASANSMHVIFGKHCIGLNRKIDMINRKVKQNDTTPMYIAEISAIDADEFTKRFYGDPVEFHSKDTTITFPTSWGANRALPAYACIMTTGNDTKKNRYHIATGWPRIDALLERYNLNEHINTPCINYSYKPRNGTLKHIYNSAIVPNKVIPFTGRVDLGVKKTQFIEDGAFSQSGLNSFPFRYKNGQIFGYENIVEKSHLIAYDNNMLPCEAQPQCHIGIEPVQSNAPSDTASAFVNACAEYEIKSTCKIGFNFHYNYANEAFASKLAFPAGYKDSKQHYYMQQNHVGGHYCYNWDGAYTTTS